VCNSSITFQSFNGTEVADVMCSNLTVCEENELVVLEATLYSDRVCTPILRPSKYLAASTLGFLGAGGLLFVLAVLVTVVVLQKRRSNDIFRRQQSLPLTKDAINPAYASGLGSSSSVLELGNWRLYARDEEVAHVADSGVGTFKARAWSLPEDHLGGSIVEVDVDAVPLDHPGPGGLPTFSSPSDDFAEDAETEERALHDNGNASPTLSPTRKVGMAGLNESTDGDLFDLDVAVEEEGGYVDAFSGEEVPYLQQPFEGEEEEA
jgi:hypothetical protein